MERKLTFVVAAIIAVVVVATISVYIAMQPEEYTGKPPASTLPVHTLYIEACNTTHVLVRNVYREPAIGEVYIYDESENLIAYINLTNHPLQPREADWAPLSQPIQWGGYYSYRKPDYKTGGEFVC